MNSARVAGGAAPLPLQVTWPEPQSAVAQVNLPVESVEHSVRAQKRPDHGVGTVRTSFALGANLNPVVDNGAPLPVWVPGQIVYAQLFVMVIVLK